MMLRRAAMKLLGAAALMAGIGVAGEARAAEVIKIGTLAPGASPWGQVFKVWAEAVSKKSEGRLELQFFYNGQQGDEGAMVGKMKAGQLDGAAVTAVGLGKIYKPILALQMPDNLNEPSHQLMREVAAQTAFASAIGDASRVRAPVLAASAYYDLLARSGARVEIWRTSSITPKSSERRHTNGWIASRKRRPSARSPAQGRARMNAARSHGSALDS